MEHIKLLERGQIATLTGLQLTAHGPMPLIIVVAVLQGRHATTSSCSSARVATSSNTSLELGSTAAAAARWFIGGTGRRSHIKRIDLALVHLLSLLYMVMCVRHRSVFLLLELLEGHLGHKSRRSV